MSSASKIIVKHFFRPEQKVVRQLPVFYPPLPHIMEADPTLEQPYQEERGEEKLDLNGYLISHPSNTFYIKLSGDHIPHLNLHPGDLLIVDQTLDMLDGNMVVGIKNETFFASFIKIKNKQLYLAGESAYDSDVLITPALKCTIWGVVSYVIHKPELKTIPIPKKKIVVPRTTNTEQVSTPPSESI